MKTLLLGFCLLCLSLGRVQSKPQITKLFPVQESRDAPVEEPANVFRPLDKFLGKLRATYDFVFRKPENASNVEKILAKDAPDPDAGALKFIWSNEMGRGTIGKEDPKSFEPRRTYLEIGDDRVNDIRPLDRSGTLEPLEFEDETEIDRDRDVEIVTPRNDFRFPVTFSRHLVDWLGSLLGITYGVYSKLARAIYNNNNTVARVY